MKKLYIYFELKLFYSISLAILGVFSLTLLLEGIKFIYANNSAGFIDNMFRHSPDYLISAVPYGCVIGAAICLSFLAKNEELTIMRCLGFNGIKLICLVAFPGIVIGSMTFLLTETVSVPTNRFYEVKEQTDLPVLHNVWFNKQETFLFIDTIQFDLKNQKMVAQELTEITFKKEYQGNNSATVSFTPIVEYSPQQSSAESPLLISLSSLFLLGLPANTRTIFELWEILQLKTEGNLSLQQKAWAFGQRISIVLFLVVLILLVTAMALYSSQRGGLFKQIAFAILLGLFTQTALVIGSFGGMIAGLPLLPFLFGQLVLYAGIGMYAIIRKS